LQRRKLPCVRQGVEHLGAEHSKVVLDELRYLFDEALLLPERSNFRQTSLRLLLQELLVEGAVLREEQLVLLSEGLVELGSSR